MIHNRETLHRKGYRFTGISDNVGANYRFLRLAREFDVTVDSLTAFRVEKDHNGEVWEYYFMPIVTKGYKSEPLLAPVK